MNTLDLNAYGVQEMNHQEMVETDGGVWPLVRLAIGALRLKYNLAKDFKPDPTCPVLMEWALTYGDA